MPQIILSSSVDGELIRYAGRCLQERHQVEIYCTVAEAAYRAQLRGGRLSRLFLRMRMYLWHPLRLCVRILLSPRATCWVVTTNPFFAPGLAAAVGRLKRQQVVHLLYDLFPDALEEAGLIAREGVLARVLGLFPKSALRYSACTIFLGEQLRTHAEQRWGQASQARVIPVVISEPMGKLPVARKGSMVEIHYGGQLGWMHDAERLAGLVRSFNESAVGIASDQLKWSFLISGAKAARFEAALTGLDVELGGTLNVEQWRARALKTEVGLVSLSEGGARVCLPSKTYGMMACGMAILAVCPAASDLGRLVQDNALGWVVDTSQGDDKIQEAFDRAVHEIVNNPEELLRRRRNAWRYIEAENKKDREGNRWSSVV